MRKFYLLFSVVCCLILAGCQNAPKPDFTEKPHIVEKRLQLQKKLLSMLPEEKREAFLKWLYDFEYDKLGLPQPDLIIYLDVPTDFTEKLLRHREQDTNTKADIHEKDMQYLATCRQIGRAAAEFYGWTVISCVKDGQMRTMDDIHQEIYSYVKGCLEA